MIRAHDPNNAGASVMRNRLAAAILAAGCAQSAPPPPPAPAPAPVPVEPTPEPAPEPAAPAGPLRGVMPVQLAFVGDINLGTRTLPDGIPPDDGRGLFDAVDSLLTGDLVVGNFEGAISDTGTSEKCERSRREVERRMRRARRAMSSIAGSIMSGDRRAMIRSADWEMFTA